MINDSAPTIRIDIFIAGDYAQAKQVCREFCIAESACVTVEPVDYVYTGGEESGVRVGFINYPRFPTDATSLYQKACRLAELLMVRLCQHSYTIVEPEFSAWFSRRKGEVA